MHRVAQLVSHVTARVAPAEAALARRTLPESAWALFESMPAADRRHALDVVSRLLQRGQDDPDLLAAALLHDAAKGHRMRLWHRVAGVLLGSLAPGGLRRLAIDDPKSWRYPFHLYLHHGPLSAEAALGAGCSPRTSAFILGHLPDAADAPLLAALVAADEAS